MNILDSHPTSPTRPAAALAAEPPPPVEPGTLRNWVGNPGLAGEANPELDARLDALHESDPAAAARLRQAMDRFPVVGSTFAGFDLVALLGRGTFGRVYLARQGELADRFVALKVSVDLAGETQTLARLQHTNIVPIYSAHRAGGFQAVCMPFFGVTTLAHLLRRFRGPTAIPSTGRQLVDTLRVLTDETAAPLLGPRTGDPGTGPASVGAVVAAAEDAASRALGNRTPTGRGTALDQLRAASYTSAVCWIGARLADGLDHAHAHGILHNDLKPANILLTDEGQPMLLDFGVSEDLRVRVATPGSPIGGTLPYMAPEHIRSVRDRIPTTDARSDVYALGLILFEMLTGQYPYRVPTGKLEDELPRMLEERAAGAPRVRPLNPAVSPGLEAIVRKCLDPDPARRYQSAGDLRDDLDRHRTDQPLRHAGVPSVRERVRKWSRRHPRLTSNLTLGLVATGLLVGSAGGLLVRQRRIEAAKADTAARLERSEARSAARKLDDDLAAAHYLLGARPPEPDTLDAGAALCRAALDRYGLPADGWESRPEFRALPPGEQAQVRDRLSEAALLLARALFLRATPGDDRLDTAAKANALAGQLAGDAAPRAVWSQRADLLRRLGQADEANRSADRAKETPLRTAEDHYLSACEELAAGRYRDAAALFRRAIELDPGDQRSHLGLGLCHEGLGQYPDATACYTTAVALWPDHHGGYRARGLVAVRSRDYARARADLDRAAELDPTGYDILLNRAMAHQGLKDWSAGLRDLDRALELGAARPRVLVQRSRLKSQMGDKAGAEKDLADGTRDEAGDADGWVARGVARIELKDYAGAAADFDAALKLNPRSIPAMQNKSHALAKLNRAAEAIQVLDGLLEKYPDYVPARAGRGVLHGRVGNAKEALADAEDAYRRDARPANVYQVAGIYALLDTSRPGSRATAVRMLSSVLRAGFGHDFIETDPDLDPIRDTPEFRRLVEGVRSLKPTPAVR